MVFAATLLLIVGTLNIIYGIGALDDANIFVNDTRLILNDLNGLGWLLIILGLIQLTGGLSLMAGNAYGQVIGFTAATLGGGRPALDRRSLSVVVAGELLSLYLRAQRNRRVHRGREVND